MIEMKRRETAQHVGDARGFTLIETSIALVILLVAALGAASLFAFSVQNNSGGSDRAQTLAVAQQQLERLRHAKFSLSGTDAVLAATPTPLVQIVWRGGQNPQDPDDPTAHPYRIASIIDDNPATSAIEVNPLATLKSITITVTPLSSGPTWATGNGGAVTITTLRAKADTP